MNYETLYANLNALEKDLKDTINLINRQNKAIIKDTESGDLNDLRKTVTSLSETIELLSQRTGLIKAEADSFDALTYFSEGDFTRQLLEECVSRGIDVRGEKGIYEMFPFKVRIYGDPEHTQEVYINRKKIASVRPKAIADTIRSSQEKLYKASFKPEPFMNELAEAYDTTCLKSDLRIGTNISLTKVYKALTPMARARKEYDMQAFAFDLARLYELGPDAWITKTGRLFTFGTSRDGKNGIRVLSRSGTESFITTLRPLSVEL